MRLSVVLVEPLYEGNVGSVARAMKNFGFSDLVLVRPCYIGEFGLAMASHARDLVEGARAADSLEEAVAGADLVVGTTGVRGRSTDRHLRVPSLTPRDLAERLGGTAGDVALLLGREDDGLSRQELALCHIVVSIPTSPGYPIMNVSHAGAVLFYELSRVEAGEVKLAGSDDLARLLARLRTALVESEYHQHKLEKTMLMLKRILGRAMLTDREVQTLYGIVGNLRWGAVHRGGSFEMGKELERGVGPSGGTEAGALPDEKR
ncbi:RNA methyltransferase [Candidatus Methanocrinis natronophilus]|uniref:RNA methyltransferase n=1 Tax=Candidatus Methanocrinis natronophilus TaxID=3033396 RepID=A0ABT5XAN6_9EURY|nr:RNA methyltransferase [Candidatus Methanocrinis natronophilus]MDF0591769.1 RNA methyltransferase [Candidatus Methanocrinis natronophilus]